MAEQAAARRLRREQGASIKEIAARLGVSTSSASRWVRDVSLAPEQQKRLELRASLGPGRGRGAEARARQARLRREGWQRDGRALARRGDRLHLAGCMLYWAEGTKTRNTATLVNSDVDLLRTFRTFLCTCYAVDERVMRFSCNCHLGNGLALAEIEQWWLDALALPSSCLRRSTVNRPSSASRWTRNTLVYGTGRLSVSSTAIVQSIYGAIQEYAGIDRPEWLD